MFQSISIRIPWHENGWAGRVCANPDRNQACRVLKNIAKERTNVETQKCEDFPNEYVTSAKSFVPPCLTESGQFMSDHEMSSWRHHPYTYNDRYAHIQDTLLSISPFSFTAIPFGWTLKENNGQGDTPNSHYYTGFDPNIETPVTATNSWITNGKNQRQIFEYFFRNITPKESMVVAYAKAVPFIETAGRIVMGIGFVESVGELGEYDYSMPPTGNQATAFLWERNIGHSIRHDRKNGFLFPFAEIQEYLREHPEQNLDELIVIAPEEYREEFSYAAEHLSHDALIQTLNKTIVVLKKYKDIRLSYGNGADWSECILWCQIQLEKVWKERGAYPGLGAILTALGVPYGFDVELALKSKYNDDVLWDNLSGGLEKLSSLLPKEQQGILYRFTKSKREDIAEEIEERRDYLELLSRINLSLSQAQLLLTDKVRSSSKLHRYADQLTDIHTKDLSESIVKNPYLLYEKTYRLEEKYQIGIGKIDLAMFPPKNMIKQFYPLSNENSFQDVDDQRRLRAIIASTLERDAANGSSLMLAENVVEAVGKFRSDVPEIEPDIRLKTITSNRRKVFFDEIFIQFPITVISESGDEQNDIALQLVRLQETSDVIRSFVENRLDTTIPIEDNWADLLNTVLGKEQQSKKEHEKAAREEKVKAIAKMAQSRISVLTGGAGTGKTTTLAALCLSKAIQAGGILVLAPTGKARVVLSSKLREHKIEHKAKTLFQFLMKTSHCDTNTYSYYLSRKHECDTPNTVIVDECSMFTEEMFAAFAEAVQGAKRVIFVGDPNQLPPIGTGKPFFELVQKLNLQESQPHYANLLISNRQKQSGGDSTRLDVELSKLFTEDSQDKVNDDLFSLISKNDENIEFVFCDDVDSLPKIMEETLVKIGIIDVESFDFSLGGERHQKWMNFTDSQAINNWQILTPYRNKEVIGTRGINAFIQARFRLPKPKTHRTTQKPMGEDGIRFGEKVINIQNQDRSDKAWSYSVWSPLKWSMEDCEKYIVNGEIGIVNGFNSKFRAQHVIQFSSQNGYNYNFNSDVSEGDSSLELAYALTVHKAQGSGFKATIFVLIEPEHGINPLVTREMLYTALTRQTDKVFIIYNKQPVEILKYESSEYSDLAFRKTNLFGKTVLRQLKNKWFDFNLIQVTVDGTLVRSKSEVIVYNLLMDAGVQPFYERKLQLGEITVHPDFTIETDRGTIYWEHLGMLGNYGYRKYWDRKKELYAEYGITEENGMLILSQDDVNGSINSAEIKGIIKKIFTID